MKHILSAICLALGASASATCITRSISIANPLDIDRTDEPVAISIDSLNPGLRVLDATVTINGQEIPSQLDDIDGDGTFDELAFVVDIAPNATIAAEILLSDQRSGKRYTPRTFAQLLLRGDKKSITPINEISVPGDVKSYNMLYGHGVMFESEINGYRIYFDQRQTLDPYGKFTRQLELEESRFYPTDDQLAQGFGDDILMVGSSCGIGALKGWNGSEATHIEPVASRSQRVISSGPVRAIVEVKDNDWQYNDTIISISQIFTQWAGHRDVNIDVRFSQPIKNEQFAIGTLKILGDRTINHRGPTGTVASWGTHWPVNDTIKYAKETVGTATYLPESLTKFEAEDKAGLYNITFSPDRDSFSYATMFCSSKEKDGIKDSTEWFALLPRWKRLLDNPLIIKIN